MAAKAKHTETHMHRHPHARYVCTRTHARTSTVNISPLASANYELDFVCGENIHKSKLSSVPYTHCESVVQNTTAEDPPGEIPEYRLDDSTL